MFKKRTKKNICVHNRGAATLPAVLSLAVFVLVIGIGLTALGFSESLISAGQSRSHEAFDFAETGARDALMRISRNKNYNCPSVDCYSIEHSSGGCADSTACSWTSVSAGVGTVGDPKIITSKGRSGNNIRKIKVEAIYDANSYGELATTTWSEVN